MCCAGPALGHPEIVVRDVVADRTDHRLKGAAHNDPFRLRVVTREKFGAGEGTIQMDRLRQYVVDDLAADIKELLASGAGLRRPDPSGPATSR